MLRVFAHSVIEGKEQGSGGNGKEGDEEILKEEVGGKGSSCR